MIKTKGIEMRDIKYIVIHCTATPQTWTAKDVERYFYEDKGWNNPGYHTVFEIDGSHRELLPIHEIANGVKGHNYHSIHITYIGGVDSNMNAFDNRTQSQQDNMALYIDSLHRGFPDAEIVGHRDLSPDLDNDGEVQPDEWVKECPSFEVSEWLNQIGIK